MLGVGQKNCLEEDCLSMPESEVYLGVAENIDRMISECFHNANLRDSSKNWNLLSSERYDWHPYISCNRFLTNRAVAAVCPGNIGTRFQ